MYKLIKSIMVIAASILLGHTSLAQETNVKNELRYPDRFSISTGLIQPLVLKGSNLELTYFTKRVSISYWYNHSLDYEGAMIVHHARDQKIAYHFPYSTGFGIGYRLNPRLDIRFEGAIRGFELFYRGETQHLEKIIYYDKTHTLGLGAYYRYMPFRKSDNWLSGITTITSLNFWPNVAKCRYRSITYFNKHLSEFIKLCPPNIGLFGTQFFFNIRIGYTIGRR